MSASLGVVVVGMGIAGKVRVRDINACEAVAGLKDVHLRGHVSRRTTEVEGSHQMSLEEALSREDVQAILICTENKLHHETARQVLEVNKHALVEFPLSLSSSGAQNLFDLAKQKEGICYEENIALLTDSHRSLKEEVTKRPSLVNADYNLQGSFNGWIENWEASGTPFFSDVCFVQCCLDIYGDLRPVEASLKRDENNNKATAKLMTASDGVITYTNYHERSEKPMRRRTYKLEFSDGSVIDSSTQPPPQRPGPGQIGLFMKDLMAFVGLVRGNKEDVEHRHWLTIRSLELAQQLTELANYKS